MQLVRAGRALRMPGPNGAPHLWFILTDPTDHFPKVVAVMLVSEKPHTDRTVTLVEGDHPFIQHPSNVDYRTATFFLVRKLEAALSLGTCHLEADMSGQLIVKVRTGLLGSPRTVNAIADYCRPLF